MLNSVQKRAFKDLNYLYDYFETNKINLKAPPTDLHQLKKYRDILDECKKERP